MRPDRPSTTAEMVCSWRALEQLLPERERMLSDPFARGFLGPARRALVDAAERLPDRALRALMRRIDRLLLRGTLGFVIARHRAMDELLCAQEGLEQVVLLGTGYDTRCARLAGPLAGATLFEVDHPATAARRARLAPTVFGDAPLASRVRVDVDFQRQSLEERLRACGFAPERPTFWIWEGVTMYLDEAAVRDTLRLVSRLSPSGSLLTCDVWCPPSRGVARLALRDLPSLAMRVVYAEPFTWSPELDALEPLFRDCGLALIEREDGGELIRRYGAPGRAPTSTSMHLCVAEVDRDGFG